MFSTHVWQRLINEIQAQTLTGSATHSTKQLKKVGKLVIQEESQALACSSSLF